MLNPNVGLIAKFRAVGFIHSSQVIVHGDWLPHFLGKYYKSGGPGVGSDYSQLTLLVATVAHKLRVLSSGSLKSTCLSWWLERRLKRSTSLNRFPDLEYCR